MGDEALCRATSQGCLRRDWRARDVDWWRGARGVVRSGGVAPTRVRNCDAGVGADGARDLRVGGVDARAASRRAQGLDEHARTLMEHRDVKSILVLELW